MLTVTCFHCGHTVSISPDAERCSICGSNLRRLLKPDQEARYFYDRAADLAATGNVAGALQEVQRGLVTRPSSELCLLGAILCKRLNRLDDMRRYVAAIPVDDALRGEAEWLLRSSQARQRVPVALDEEDVDIAPPTADADLPPLLMEEVKPSATPRPGRSSRLTPVLWAAVVLLLALVGGWWLLDSRPESGVSLVARVFGAEVPAITTTGDMQAPERAAGSAAESAAESVATPPTSATAGQDTPPAQQVDAQPTPVPTPEVPDNLVVGAGAGRCRAHGRGIGRWQSRGDYPRRRPGGFDLVGYMEGKGMADLAALPVTARVEGERLILEGTVEMAEQRARIGFLAQQIPDFAEVSIVNVLVKLPAEYEVQSNDTLWDISVRLYGDAAHIDSLFGANQDVLPSRDALQVGMRLKVPLE